MPPPGTPKKSSGTLLLNPSLFDNNVLDSDTVIDKITPSSEIPSLHFPETALSQDTFPAKVVLRNPQTSKPPTPTINHPSTPAGSRDDAEQTVGTPENPQELDHGQSELSDSEDDPDNAPPKLSPRRGCKQQ